MRRSSLLLSSAVAAALAAAGVTSTALGQDAEPVNTMLVIDASNSMWGQIDGVNKIVIAKDVVDGLLYDIPAERRLGLVAYGHRRQGDCSDIEVLAQPGADRDAMRAAVRGLSPRGRTPLTDSVRVAAETLAVSDGGTSSVILISDGLETCEADPCALAAALKAANANFTIHVVGFDVTEEERAGLICMAEETGGLFIAADDAESLAEALSTVTQLGGDVAPEPTVSEPVPSHVVLKATILSGGPQIQSQLAWSVTPAAGGDAVFTASETGVAETDILPGDYHIDVTWTGWRDETPKTGALDISINDQNTHVYTLPIDLGLPVTLEAPASTPEGVAVDVTWSGPDDLGGIVSIAAVEDSPLDRIFFFAGERSRDAYADAAEDGADLDTDGDGDFDQDDAATSVLGIPPIAGAYEVRYSLSSPSIVLARRPIEVTDSIYTLNAPESAPISSQITVEWDGPLTPGDTISLAPVGQIRPLNNTNYTRIAEGEPATLTAPSEPGEYEIRYVMATGYTT